MTQQLFDDHEFDALLKKQVREEHQRLFSERRKVKREKSRRGLFLPPLDGDDAEPDMLPSEKLETALAESKKRRQQRP
ncbi:hypothetical protein [Streptomyces aureocirculatus]|uniref:hypothetical protein n=1 Tax=Streptomyces aureocirculatus TaxID=67275 RepID=UPI001CED3107|nr:hypothetical protein [Streptomyces aureocirculatus]